MTAKDSRPTRVRRVLLTLAAFLAGAALWLVATGDRIAALDRPALEAAQQRWRQAAIADYALELRIEGRELPGGVIALEVRGGRPASARRDGVAMPGDASAYTVDGLLETLEREIVLAEHPQGALGAPPGYRAWLHAEFDPLHGLPRRFRRVVGGGSGRWVEWEIRRFEAR